MVVPSKSCDGQFVAAGARHDVVERLHVLREVSAPAFLMFGTLSERVPSLPATSTAMPILIWLCTDAKRFAVRLRVGMIERRIGSNRFDDGPADDVRVGNFALARQRAMLIDHTPVLVDYLDRNDALRCCQRDAKAGIHVLGDARGGAAQRNRVSPVGPDDVQALRDASRSAVGCGSDGAGATVVRNGVSPFDSNTFFQLSSTALRSFRYC